MNLANTEIIMPPMGGGTETVMTLDKKTLDKLLSLDDDRLISIIRVIAAESGVDLGNFNISPSDLAGIRAALSVATDSDIQRAGELLKNYKNAKNQ